MTNQPSFSTSFWAPNPTSALTPLYAKLHQGTLESDQVLGLIKSKASMELHYGRDVYNLKHDHKPNGMTGFGYEGGGDEEVESSLKNSYLGLLSQISNEGQTHLRISEELTSIIVKPFEGWSKGHKMRVEDSKKVVFRKIKEWEKELNKVEILKGKYFAKWKEFEDMKVGLTEKEINEQLTPNEEDEEDEEEDEEKEENLVIKLGPIDHTISQLQETLLRMIQEIPQTTTKVTLLGTYTHTLTGLQICSWLQTNLSLSLSQCEEFGQSLMDQSFIRKINTSIRDGLAGSAVFIGSRSFVCQWKPMAYKKAGLSDPFEIEFQQMKLTNTETNKFSMNGYFDELKATYLEDRTLLSVSKEIEKLDGQYLQSVIDLDILQCSMHEVILDNLKLLEIYERDRIQALKRVMLDYATIIRTSLNQLEDSTAKILTFRESININADIQLLISEFATGSFKPFVVIYDNYHKLSKPQYQLFGSELVNVVEYEGGKGVPLIITTILQYLDEEIYPSLKDDQERVNIWLKNADLKEQYRLRNALQHKQLTTSIILTELKRFEPLTITSLLKLYLLTLPTSLIPQTQYDLLKSLYFQHTTNSIQRHTAIINILKSSLPKQHYQTLRVLLKHFIRIAGIIKEADSTLYDFFIKGLSVEMGKVIIMKENHEGNDSMVFKEKFMKELLVVKELTGGKNSGSTSRSSSFQNSSKVSDISEEEIIKIM